MKTILEYQFIQKLKKLSFVDAIWLFGSRARNDNQTRSDIDIAIICPDATHADWAQVIEIVEHADTLLEIDCIRFEPEKMDIKLKNNILKSKKVIYMKKMQWHDSF
ncbi:nucleotidyltransferase domain-containing protein [bacterium]|nr:MAG: nucleotidyltransferase domain-containing protein [bacterium]